MEEKEDQTMEDYLRRYTTNKKVAGASVEVARLLQGFSRSEVQQVLQNVMNLADSYSAFPALGDKLSND